VQCLINSLSGFLRTVVANYSYNRRKCYYLYKHDFVRVLFFSTGFSKSGLVTAQIADPSGRAVEGADVRPLVC